MPDTAESLRPMRADARNNRDRILTAARHVFVEKGARAPLDEIARRAGTGIATLYRRFPDRQSLMRSVVMDALQQTADEARRAAAEESDPFAALVRYMHRALDIRTGAVIPALLDEISLADEEMEQARSAGVQPLQDMIDAAQRAGSLRHDVTFGDIGLLIVRMSRPLPGPFPPDVNDSLGHRHLDLVVNGLRPGSADSAQITGPGLTLADLREMAPVDTPNVSGRGPA
jgi:AcrR family transcriptional regulator